jgi:malate permease and related proteins
MDVIETIAPIFLIILFGYIIRGRGLLPDRFIEEANRFIFLFSLPLLIFTGIVRSNIKDVSLTHITLVVLPTCAVLCMALMLGIMGRLKSGRLGTFVQAAFHGNVTFIGLAVLFYMVGEEGLNKGAILIGCLILVNNTLAVGVVAWNSQNREDVAKALVSIITNPVVIATFLGILVLYFGIPLPGVLLKSMRMLGTIALPLALVIIGASMSLGAVKKSFHLAALVTILKLMVLPLLPFLYGKFYALPLRDLLPGIILLATPTAITAYVLAKEMGGDPDLASSAITLSTLMSPLAFVFWTYVAR